MRAKTHFSTVVLTKAGKDIPYGVLTDNSFVTDDVSTFVALMGQSAERGFVNFADYWSLDAFHQALANTADLPVFYFLPFDRVFSINPSDIPDLNLCLHRGLDCFWVRQGNMLRAQLELSQQIVWAERNLVDADRVLFERDVNDKSRLSTEVDAQAHLKRVIAPIYKRFGRCLPAFARRGLFKAWSRIFR